MEFPELDLNILWQGGNPEMHLPLEEYTISDTDQILYSQKWGLPLFNIAEMFQFKTDTQTKVM